jgi:ankyrin repeat protein
MNLTTPRTQLAYLPWIFLVAGLIGIAGAASVNDIEALYEAAGDGDANKVTALLDSGVDVNGRSAKGSYALNNAAVENEVEVMKILLARGADPNVRNSQGDTPLICATKYAGGKAATVKLLVESGTDLTIQDDKGKTALDYAKAKEEDEAVVLLTGSNN